MTTFTLISCSWKPNLNICTHTFSEVFFYYFSWRLKIGGRCCIQVPVSHFCSCCAPRRLTEVNEHKLLGEQELANKQINKHFLTAAKELSNGICYPAALWQIGYINSCSSKNVSAPHLSHKPFNTVLFKQTVVYTRIQETPWSYGKPLQMW